MTDNNDDSAKDIESRVIMAGGGISMHDAFQRDVLRLLENTDISDEDRQRILANTACPCCGGSASMAIPLTKSPLGKKS
jgi:hypothetical protein